MHPNPTFSRAEEAAQELPRPSLGRPDARSSRAAPSSGKLVVITGPVDAAGFIQSILRDDAREHFVALYLNGAHQVVSYSLVALGSANAVNVHPREVFQGAILAGACTLIVGHNHPSGDLKPSDADCSVTKRLTEAGQLLGIKLLDHVIVSHDEYFSFQDDGRLPMNE